MKTLLGMIALTISFSALADLNRLTIADLKVVTAHNMTEKFRVYTKKKMKLQYTTSAETTEVDQGIDKKLKIKNVTVTKKAAGKIIAVDSIDRRVSQYTTYGTYNSDCKHALIYVSFSPSCVEKSCAFQFVSSAYMERYCGTDSDNSEFMLLKRPQIAGMKLTYDSTEYSETYLHFDLGVLNEVISLKQTGW